MNSENKLKKLIDTKKAKICVMGLGYVGLPIVVEFVKKGFFVFGLDTSSHRIADLARGESYITDISSTEIKKILKTKKFFPTMDSFILKNADIIIVCVPTPLRKRKIPDVSYIIKASRTIAKYIRTGQLIVLESTTYPGTTRDIMLPILSKTSLCEGKDFFLSFSPERIDPGNPKYNFRNIPKIAGGISEKATSLTKRLYSKVIETILPVSTAETAEVVKLLENTFRIVNIGLINEFAMLCNKLNIDVWEVVEAAKTKPFGFMPFYPGPGLGGHCIPADPLYLSWKARRVGFKAKMIDLAAKTNLFMPHYAVSRVEELLKTKNKNIKKSKILLLGVTYKKDVKDLREAPALDIIESLHRKGADISYYDPYIPYLSIGDIDKKRTDSVYANFKKYDLVILTTAHSKFNYKRIAKGSKLILDTRNAFGGRGIKGKNIIKL